MDIKFETQVKVKPWVKDPALRWNFGLKRAGLVGWKGSLQKYPRLYGPDAGGYKRTGALGNKADFRILQTGKLMQFLGTFYTTFALFGTGIYGPKGTPIRPVKAKMLAWKNTGRGNLKIASGVKMVKGKIRPNARKDTYLIFAKQVRGFIWHGKLEEVKDAIIRAFTNGVKNYRESDQ